MMSSLLREPGPTGAVIETELPGGGRLGVMVVRKNAALETEKAAVAIAEELAFLLNPTLHINGCSMAHLRHTCEGVRIEVARNWSARGRSLANGWATGSRLLVNQRGRKTARQRRSGPRLAALSASIAYTREMSRMLYFSKLFETPHAALWPIKEINGSVSYSTWIRFVCFQPLALALVVSCIATDRFVIYSFTKIHKPRFSVVSQVSPPTLYCSTSMAATIRTGQTPIVPQATNLVLN